MDRIQHLADWRAAWDKVAALTTERDRFARESLELVRAALIYHYNALEMYEETEFHERLRRQPAASVTTSARWPITDDPLFPVLMSSPAPRLGGIFLASASVR